MSEVTSITAEKLRDMPSEATKQKLHCYLKTAKEMVLTAARYGKTNVVYPIPTMFQYENLNVYDLVDEAQTVFIDCEVILVTTTVMDGRIERGIRVNWLKM